MVAATPNAVDAFGQVDDVEVRAEAVDQLAHGAGLEAPYHGLELLFARGRSLTPADRGDAGCLDALKDSFAGLLADHCADKATQQPNIVSQGGVLVGELHLAVKRDAHGDRCSRHAATISRMPSAGSAPVSPSAPISRMPSAGSSPVSHSTGEPASSNSFPTAGKSRPSP